MALKDGNNKADMYDQSRFRDGNGNYFQRGDKSRFVSLGKRITGSDGDRRWFNIYLEKSEIEEMYEKINEE